MARDAMAIVRHPKDFYAGLLFIAFGVFAIVVGSELPAGHRGADGPGLFSALLGILLMCSAPRCRCVALRLQGPPVPGCKWRPVAIVLGSVVLFGLIVDDAGLVLSTIVLDRRRQHRQPRIPLEGSARRAASSSRHSSSRVFVIGLQAAAPDLAPLRSARTDADRWTSSTTSRLASGVALTPINLLYAFIGSLLGTLIGVLPGIGPVATIAMLLPTTYALQPVSALIMLAGIYYGAQYGGSTTSILLNMPGETVVGGHLPRRPPDGASRAGRRGARDRGARLVLRRHASPRCCIATRCRRRCRSSRSNSDPPSTSR